jgi:hypothetical protein
VLIFHFLSLCKFWMPSSLAFASISVSIPTKFIIFSLVLLSSFFWNDLVVTFLKMVKSFGGCQQLFFFSRPYVLVSIVVKSREVLKQVIDTVKMGAAGEGAVGCETFSQGFPGSTVSISASITSRYGLA